MRTGRLLAVAAGWLSGLAFALLCRAGESELALFVGVQCGLIVFVVLVVYLWEL